MGGFPPRGFFDHDEPVFRRLPTEPSFPTIRISGRAAGWIVFFALAGLLLLLLQPFASLYTDWLWFQALGFGSVFGVRFLAQLVSFFLFALVFWAAGSANVLIALTSGRRLSSIGIRQRLVTTPTSLIALLAVFLLGLLFARVGASQWQNALSFLRQSPFGVSDPIWHKDVAFYVFSLPFYRFLWGWSLFALIVIILGVAGLYASRTGFQNIVLPKRAVRHLSVLAASFAVLLAVHYRLNLYELLLDKRGFVNGAGYADLTARVPAYWIMFGLMILFALGLLLNLGPARLEPLALAGAAWVLAVFVFLVAFPAIVQRFAVAPAELDRETPYIQNEITFTRQAYGLASIADKPLSPAESVSPDAVARNPETVQNARLWDPIALLPTLNQQQSLRPYYDFADLAIDRYRLGGEYQQLLLAARELSLRNVPKQWVNQKLQFTHGYGLVANRANEATPEGLPLLKLKDIPPVGEPAITRPAIYFGRRSSPGDYVLVHSKGKEFDYPQGDENQYTQWSGTKGVSLSSAFRRLAFAMRFGDINIIASTDITPQTQVLFQRQVQERARALAPFLRFDSDPYVAAVDGNIYWIQDAYTVSDHYPYSQPTPLAGQLSSINYIRNSVKIVIDAYDGATTFYQIDTQDPIVRTYASIFPGLFKSFDTMPAGLKDHIRYPTDLFSIQADAFRRYHMQDPRVFYNNEDLWSIANEKLSQSSPTPIRPFYVIMRLPGESRAEFLTILPYTPSKKNNMIAYLAARSDVPNYGGLLDFRFSKDKLIVGPEQVEANIDQTPSISQLFTLLNQQGSRIIRGNLLVLPIEDGLLYVEPIYLQAEGLPFPELKKVIVATGQRVAMEDTLDKALAALLGTQAPSQPGTVSGPTIAPGSQAADLIAAANQHYKSAQDLLRQGDFAGYAREIQEVGRILQQLQALQPQPSPSPKPGASPRPSPSPTR